MTDLYPMPEDIRLRLARRYTPEAIRSEWVSFGLVSSGLLFSVHRDLMSWFEMSRPAALIAIAGPLCLGALLKSRRLKVRRAEEFSQSEVESALIEAAPCKRCSTPVLSHEWACPRCGSTLHQYWPRPEFLPFVSIPLIAVLLYGLLGR
jgi:hypothetical protein